MIDLSNPQNIDYIVSIITTHNYKKVVLQLNKKLLSKSFWLTSKLRSMCPADVQFYTLYDSLRNPCCSDIISAKHVDYEVLFHFGYACFSEKFQLNHHYILPQLPVQQQQKLADSLANKQVIESIKNNNISLLLCDQSIYRRVIKIKQKIEKQAEVEVARLPFDQVEGDSYFGFSYFCSSKKNRNILVITPDSLKHQKLMFHQEQENLTSDLLLQNLSLCKKQLLISKIFILTQENILQYNESSNKRLMQRISQISQLQKYKTFGIVVSNPSTKFCQHTIKRLRYILERKGLNHFTFMMNNLNECKLGNFPQIQVYIVISCYNYSLYSIKDFYRLVVSPYDIQVAFGEGNYESYQFDLNALKLNQNGEKEDHTKQMMISNQKSLTIQNKQLLIYNSIQTLDNYRDRQYKGLNFSQKKSIQKIRKGKIGTATSYHPISDDNKTNQII